jgi:hypothetical protein
VCAMHDGSLVAVVGEGPRQEALRAIADTATDATPFLGDLRDYALEVAQEEPERRWFRAVLAREPDNPHDSNAIAVYAEGGQQVGYLSREHASTYRQVFESVAKRGYEGATCPAMLAGGGDKHYGVVLALSSPGHVMGYLHAEEHTAKRAERTSAKEERGQAIFEAALRGEPWDAIAATHGYSTPGGAYAAARTYAERHGLELPRRSRGRPRKSEGS